MAGAYPGEERPSAASWEDAPQRYPVGWAIPIVLAVTLPFAGAVGMVGFITPYLGQALSAIAAPYTGVALVVTIIVRLVVRRRVIAYDDRAFHFQTLAQRCSLVFGVALLLSAAFAVVLSALRHSDGESEMALFGIDSWYILLCGIVAVPLGIGSIISNAAPLYLATTIAAESLALRHRAGNWRLILASRIVNPVVWIVYTGLFSPLSPWSAVG